MVVGTQRDVKQPRHPDPVKVRVRLRACVMDREIFEWEDDQSSFKGNSSPEGPTRT